MKLQEKGRILDKMGETTKNIFYHLISFIKKIAVITTTLAFSWIVFSFVFEGLYFISIPLTLYTTDGIHIFTKFYTSFYDIPYDHLSAYYKAVEKYERDKRELVYGELVDHGPLNIIQHNFKVWFDFSGMTQQFNSGNYQDKKLVA